LESRLRRFVILPRGRFCRRPASASGKGAPATTVVLVTANRRTSILAEPLPPDMSQRPPEAGGSADGAVGNHRPSQGYRHTCPDTWLGAHAQIVESGRHSPLQQSAQLE